MKVEILFLSLLVLKSFSGLECSVKSSGKSFDQLAREAMCAAKCGSSGNHAECKLTCIEHRHNVTVLDVEAKANLRLVCRDEDNVVWGFDSGVFIGEHRGEIGDWDSVQDVLIDGQLTADVLDPSSRYQWRFTRAFANGISRPEVTEWITALAPDIKPKRVPKIWVQCLEQEERMFNEHSPVAVRAEMGFQPSEDRCCSYRVTCRQNQGTYNRTISVNIGKGSKTLTPIFTDLELGASFTVIVDPQGSGVDGDSTVTNFGTPLIWKADGASRVCVPVEVEGLDATVIHGMGNISHVYVTWYRPVWLPDFFIADCKTNWRGPGSTYRVFHNVSGTTTETIFRGMEVSREFNVSIRAWSMLGKGPESSKRFTVPQRT